MIAWSISEALSEKTTLRRLPLAFSWPRLVLLRSAANGPVVGPTGAMVTILTPEAIALSADFDVTITNGDQ